jgi:imidazolonepropionase-like amidohydrolase
VSGLRWLHHLTPADTRLVAGAGDASVLSIGIDPDGRIAWLGPSRDAPGAREHPAGAPRVVVPGFVDTHLHLFRLSDGDPLGTYLASDDDERMGVARSNARVALSAGVTTGRDLGGPVALSARLADATARDPSLGPSLVFSGAPLTRPGGDDHAFGGGVDTPAGAIELVDTQVAQGAAVVVMVVSGGGLTPGTSPAAVELDVDVMRAARDHAERLGVPVVARCHATAGMIICRDLAVDGIEHASFLDADGVVRFDRGLAASLAGKGVAIGPTLFAARQALARYQSAGVANPDDLFAMTRLAARTDNFVAWLEAGVRLAAGSASGYLDVPASSLADEAIAYVDAGMDPADALHAITLGNARVLGRDDIGRIEVGRRADLVLFDTSPLEDMTRLRRPTGVFRGGRLVAGAGDAHHDTSPDPP